jgi:ATP-dependent Lhr-like helicase
VTFPESAHDVSWADALVELVKDGRARSVEVRKVDGEPVGDEIAAVLRAAGFVDGYRGLVARG